MRLLMENAILMTETQGCPSSAHQDEHELIIQRMILFQVDQICFI